MPNSESPSLENVSIDPLGDSVLMDNSLLESSALTTTGNSSTEDSNSENRHPLPNHSDVVYSNSSTPINSNKGGNGTGPNPALPSQQSNPPFSDLEFWKSPIPKVDEDNEINRLAEGIQDMSLEDLEDSSSGAQEGGDKSVKEGLNSERLKGVDVQGKLDFEETTDSHHQGTGGSEPGGSPGDKGVTGY